MILLDTHVLVWVAVEPRRLSRAAASAIRQATVTGGLAIASITLWELAFLFGLSCNRESFFLLSPLLNARNIAIPITCARADKEH